MIMSRRVLAAAAALGGVVASAEWYTGIDSITVLTPEDGGNQKIVDDIFQAHQEDAFGNASAFQKGQFGMKRRAILLPPGDYGNLSIPVAWYTTVLGAGLSPKDVVLKGISSIDAYPGSVKGCLEDFWKGVEGVTTTENKTLWAVSQAAPLRRSHIKGDLHLTEDKFSTDNPNGTHYASGGYIADIKVDGTVNLGAQQQFFFRSSEFGDVDTSASNSLVFVGVKGAPQHDQNSLKPLLVNHEKTPVSAEKPYLAVENGVWNIVVPRFVKDTVGVNWNTSLSRLIPMDDVCIARPGDNADTINKCIAEPGIGALLFTPGFYALDKPIDIARQSFVVLGIGMPTLVVTQGLSAIVVHESATKVRVASVVIEAGTPEMVDITMPLLHWQGDKGHVQGVFTRVGTFAYETSFHKSCQITKANVMLQVEANEVVVDNAWLWHADHDDCNITGNVTPSSDLCTSQHGLVVTGDDVVAYGLAVEHTKEDLLVWEGENGRLYFFQSELPYRSNLDFGNTGQVGYRVSYSVQKHHAWGVGVYQVFPAYNLSVSIRMPSTAKVQNMFAWDITGNRTTLGHLVCTAPGLDQCLDGDCTQNACHLLRFPAEPNQTKNERTAAAAAFIV